jgi:hypothetical protein
MTPLDERETMSPLRPGAGETTMDSRGFLYDDEGVVRYVHPTTGLPKSVGNAPERHRVSRGPRSARR